MAHAISGRQPVKVREDVESTIALHKVAGADDPATAGRCREVVSGVTCTFPFPWRLGGEGVGRSQEIEKGERRGKRECGGNGLGRREEEVGKETMT